MDNLDHTYTLPTGSTTITKSMLDDIREQKQIKHVIIPLGVTSIEKKAFNRCSSLTSIHIPNSVRRIRERAFEICTSLTSISIPDGITSIDDSLFTGCTNLTSITIPNSVTTIKVGAFENCYSLTSIIIPNSVTGIGEKAFWGCKSLNSIIIPDSVIVIPDSAFFHCESLTSITIPNSVTSIEGHAFCRCFSLTSITIPESVTHIGNSAFSRCRSLTSITIPDRVTEISECAFARCSSLTSITIPNSVTSIERHAFGDCYNMRLVIIPTSLKRQDTNYWTSIGINLQQTTLITHDQLSNWKDNQILSRTCTRHELAILYQLQKEDNFTPSWPELGKLVSNLMMGDLLEVLPEEKKNIVLPKIYKNISTIDYLQNCSLFRVTPEKSRKKDELKADHLEKNDFKEYKNTDDPTKTIHLKEVSTAASSAILSRLTIKEVATLLNVKVSSELRPTLS